MNEYIGKTVEEALEKASAELNTPVEDLIYLVTDKTAGLLKKKIIIEIYDLADIIEYSENFIRKLKRYGLKLAVVTSDTTSHATQVLKILKIDDCFDIVIGKDSCSKDKKTGEPAILALEKLNSKKENTLVIGDALMDYQMAKNANLKSILIATGQTNISDLKKCTNYVVKNLSEVEIK